MSVRYLKNEPLNYDEALLKKDRYTFSVLQRILKMNCQLTITDDETFIICLSAKGYPVWVWTVDGISEEKLAEVFKITMQEFPPEEFHYNIKYEPAEYFMAQASDLKLLMNMMTYECLETVAPTPRTAVRRFPARKRTWICWSIGCWPSRKKSASTNARRKSTEQERRKRSV